MTERGPDATAGLTGWGGSPDGQEPAVAIFMSDPSAEAERLAQLLRARGHVVADVPLALLATRVAVQTPRVIVVDADAAGAAEAVANVERTEWGPGVEIFLLGERAPEPGTSLARELCDGSSAFFARPVDAAMLVQKIEALAGPPGTGPGTGPGAGPPSRAPRSAPPRSLPPASIPSRALERRSPPPAAGVLPSTGPISARPPSSGSGAMSARSARPAISIQTTLSSELEALLAEAEQRIGSQMANEAAPPTPEEELEAVLPEALLAALDEPLDDDEDDIPAEAPRSRPSRNDAERSLASQAHDARQHTSAGRPLTPGFTDDGFSESLGVAPTMAAPARVDMELLPAIPDAPVPRLDPFELYDAPPPPPLPLPAEPPSLPPEREAPVGARSPLGPGDAPRPLAGAIAGRASGCLTIESADGDRRIVVRDGDLVTAASTVDDEALLVFLTSRGDLRREQVRDLVGKVPASGRHAGAALVGHGLLRQDQLWPTLRAHAEWVVGKALLVDRGAWRMDPEPPGRLRQEPSVFGGSSGAEVLVDLVRRVITPEEALRRLGGPDAMVVEGPSALLSECALEPADRALIDASRGASVGDIARRAAGAELASVVYALALLGVLQVSVASVATGPGTARRDSIPPRSSIDAVDAVDALDSTAVRERVRARKELVAEADYFALLGVGREATGYEVRRAYLELRRSFEPTRLLTPELADLAPDVEAIVAVLEEAYDILRDPARRERYRRALGG